VDCSALQYFSTFSHKRRDFGGKKFFEQKICVLILSTTFASKFVLIFYNFFFLQLLSQICFDFLQFFFQNLCFDFFYNFCLKICSDFFTTIVSKFVLNFSTTFVSKFVF